MPESGSDKMQSINLLYSKIISKVLSVDLPSITITSKSFSVCACKLSIQRLMVFSPLRTTIKTENLGL